MYSNFDEKVTKGSQNGGGPRKQGRTGIAVTEVLQDSLSILECPPVK